MANEHDLARAWRESWGLTQEELGEMTGYSREAVWWMEAGKRPNAKRRGEDTRIPPWIWLRYKTSCAAVDAMLRSGRGFVWEPKPPGERKQALK